MSTRTDYAAAAEQIDYPKLDKKLDQLQEQPPPKKRKRAADLLAPLRGKLLGLHGKGWTYERLAQELNESGLPVKAATLRDYLTGREHKRKSKGRQRGSKSA
jgi:hypothetical protein